MRRTQGSPLTQAERDIIEDNLALIWKVVWRHHPRDDHEAADWTQEGVLAAITALRTHDPTRSKLSTWITKEVYFHIYQYKWNRGLIHLPCPDQIADHNQAAFERAQIIKPLGHSVDEECLSKSYTMPLRDEALDMARRRLNKREKKVVYLYYDKGLLAREIAALWGISVQRVTFILRGALEKMRATYCKLEKIA